MDSLIVIAVMVAGIVFLVFFLTNQDDEKKEKNLPEYPYIVSDNFLSPAELNFFRTLQQIVGNQAIISIKVGLGDIFWVKPKDKSKFRAYRNKITHKHVDFLLCDPATMRPIVGIELDDKSHQRKDRQERDAFVDKVFNAARLPLIHVPVKRGYVTAELVTKIAPYLGRSVPIPQVRPTTQFTDSGKTCPKCSSEMVLRTTKKGTKSGQQFWGCSAYPNCKTMLPYTE